MNKFKIFEIIQTIFCGYKEIKIKFNNTKTKNSPNIWKLNNTLIWGQWGHLKGNKKTKYSFYWKFEKKIIELSAYISTINNWNSCFKNLQEQIKPKSSRRGEKIREEKNAIDFFKIRKNQWNKKKQKPGIPNINKTDNLKPD